MGVEEQQEAEIRDLLDPLRTTHGKTEGRLAERRWKLAELALQAKRALGVQNNARDDGELAAATEMYEQRRAEHAKVEGEVRRLESQLGLLVSDGEDSVAHYLGFLERFDRLLRHLPEDQLRSVFEALGVRIKIDFGPNTSGRSRPRRVPIGGCMSFMNDITPAVAEVKSIDDNETGCGGGDCTQYQSIPIIAMLVLNRRPRNFQWIERDEVEKLRSRLVPLGAAPQAAGSP